jgi:peroxiredoxin
LANGQEARQEQQLDAVVLGISTNHTASQRIFREQLALSYPLLSAFDAPEVVEDYVGWLDREKRLSQRAYVLIDTDGIVRFVRVMQNPAEVLAVSELEAELAKLTAAQ